MVTWIFFLHRVTLVVSLMISYTSVTLVVILISFLHRVTLVVTLMVAMVTNQLTALPGGAGPDPDQLYQPGINDNLQGNNFLAR